VILNETLVRDLAGAGFLLQQRNLVLVGGTGTGKTHLAVGIARTCIRGGARGRFFNVVDLVNKLEAEARAGRQGRLADRSVMPGELAGAGAINAPISRWMAWRIDRRTEREDGIPHGLPYLTGWVTHFQILDETQA
jgi:hypothetical protein